MEENSPKNDDNKASQKGDDKNTSSKTYEKKAQNDDNRGGPKNDNNKASPKNDDNSGSRKNEEDEAGPSEIEFRPLIKPEPVFPVKDPVKEQRKKDKTAFRRTKLEVIPEQPTVSSAIIAPTMNTRLGMNQAKYEAEHNREFNATKFAVPRTKKREQWYLSRRADTAKKYHCKKRTMKTEDPLTSRKVGIEFTVPSPEASNAKVTPRRVTPTQSWLQPYPQTSSELRLKKPKSGIFINEKDKKTDSFYDSFDLVYQRKPRPKHDDRRKARVGKKKRKKKRDTRRKSSVKEEQLTESPIPEEEYLKMVETEMAEAAYGEGDHLGVEEFLTKQFRRKVSQISAATSYQSKDVRSDITGTEIEMIPAVEKYIQKFRRESEIKRYEPKRRKFKRGTLESHSFTNVHQAVLKDFYFGSKQGTMHQGDEHFDERFRNCQGICVPVTAYCRAIITHPNKWTAEVIDEILDAATDLYDRSRKLMHKHEDGIELKPHELDKYVYIGDRKVRFQVEDAEITGMIRSTDKRVFNLSKALNIFFKRQNAGVLQTQDTNIAIWKDKYFYFFDAKPRTKDLYYNPEHGLAIMANFYDVAAVLTVLLQRSNFLNWPFVIYPIKAFKVLDKDESDDDEKHTLDSRSNYNILNENKAVLSGSYDLGDKCFGFTRSKQSLTMAAVSLVYSRITPPSSWHRSTIDKIMLLGDQLYIECMRCEDVHLLTVDYLPALFTIGPYMIEIYIYVNRFVDLMYKNCACEFKNCLEQFFECNTNCIAHINRHNLAIWKQRNMFFCFDPYSRDNEGFECRDGVACVSMHATIESLVNTITTNYENKDSVFALHALKVCKIHRDPVQTAFPKHIPLEDFSAEDLKHYKMRKSKKAATEKPVTVDYSALAMRRLLAGEDPEPSVYEIGSNVGSIATDQLPPLLHKFPTRALEKTPLEGNIIADLDSPSLTETQIEPPRPVQPKDDAPVEFLDLDTFELTQEEIELQEVFGGGEGDGEKEGKEQEGEEDSDKAMKEMEKEMIKEMGEGGEDWFYTETRGAQVGEFSLPYDVSKISEQVNTDLTYFPIHKEVLYPTYIRGRQNMRKRINRVKDDQWADVYMPPEPEATQSEELRKETNFIELPDDTEIIRGTKNIGSLGEDVEFTAPFVCVMACVVAKKYSVLSWSGEIVDYVLKCGAELFKSSKFRYDQVSKLEIPRIALGKTGFAAYIEYVFDSYTRQNILALAIDKILLVRSDMGVLVTPSYACAVIYKNHLYYMYDGFGSNEVGLSEGDDEVGVACFSRFKNIQDLTTRIMHNKKKREEGEEIVYTRFVLSTVKVKRVEIKQKDTKKRKKDKAKEEGEEEGMTDGETGGEGEEQDEEEEEAEQKKEKKKKKTKIKVGYKRNNGMYVLEGSTALEGRDVVSVSLKEDHFVCLCACLLLLSVPINKWDNKKIDDIIEHGKHVFAHADDLDISEKRTIKNVLIQKHFFDIVVKKVKIANYRDNKNLNRGIETLLRKKMNYFLVQFPNACVVIHRTADGCFHIFDPYGVPQGNKDDSGPKAGWIRCKDLKAMKYRLKKLVQKGAEGYDFYTFEVTSIRKAPKDMLINYKLNEYDPVRVPKSEHSGMPFYEDTEWLDIEPVPWSRRVGWNPEGKERGSSANNWKNWEIEYANDLYSLLGKIHQTSERFSEESRGRQTLCNLITCIGMMEIYDLSDWNAAVVDSILVNGDNFFAECVADIKEEDYELSMDDLKEDCSIFPFSFKVAFKPVVEGMMFLVRPTQYNLYKALTYFFKEGDRRLGVCCITKNDKKKQVAFGKTKKSEYFMFDCDTLGHPMFLDRQGVAYILRMTTLNRLLHVMTMTLRGGTFFIYEVKVTDVKPIS